MISRLLLFCNNISVIMVESQKQLGLVADSKSSFNMHIKIAIDKVNKKVHEYCVTLKMDNLERLRLALAKHF